MYTKERSKMVSACVGCRYYQDIKLMPAISEQDMNAMLAEESRVSPPPLHMTSVNPGCDITQHHRAPSEFKVASTIDFEFLAYLFSNINGLSLGRTLLYSSNQVLNY